MSENQNENWPIIKVISTRCAIDDFNSGQLHAERCWIEFHLVSNSAIMNDHCGINMQSSPRLDARNKHCGPRDYSENVSITELFHQIQFMLS